MINVEFGYNNCSIEELINIHIQCDNDFVPQLSSRVNIVDYATKLFTYADIVTISNGNFIIGVLAIYLNDFYSKIGYVTSICIRKEFRRNNLSKTLLDIAIEKAVITKMTKLNQE